MKTIFLFRDAYEDSLYQESLSRLYADLGDQEPKQWAQQLYETLRDDPTNVQAKTLNMDRKKCLQLLYDMVDAWEKCPNPDAFEQQIYEIFEAWRLKRILYIGHVMDRAQALYRMQLPTSTLYGMHWYCKYHLEDDDKNKGGAVPEPPVTDTVSALKAALADYPGYPTMNRRLFKLLHTERFGLLHEDYHLAKWSEPTLATFLPPPPRNSATVNATKEPCLPPAGATGGQEESQIRHLPTEEEQKYSFDDIVQKFVDAYDDESYQQRLSRLYMDRGTKGPEEWAKLFCLDFRDNNDDARALMLNQDRKECLCLLYDMVDEWKNHGFSPAFEDTIVRVFKARRIARILGVCLVMDRAQSLYKMILPAKTSDGKEILGMHWYSELHFQNDTFASNQERLEWKELLSNYSGTATMNKRLYRLLYSEALGLQGDKEFARWSQPQPANFVYRRPTTV
ncbi:hypothetical protein ACA910_017842 [Epithemia clementina (nom. ined.)]